MHKGSAVYHDQVDLSQLSVTNRDVGMPHNGVHNDVCNIHALQLSNPDL